jgi:hypothetical protein
MDPAVIAVIAIVALLLFALQWLGIMWVHRDAVRRGRTDGIPTLMAVLMGPFGILFWFVSRPPLPADRSDQPSNATNT